MSSTNNLGGDNIALNFRVYIEGVQVPFESVSINSVFKELPTAQITVPPYKGMESLGLNYFPKVHVFYLDPNQGVADYKQVTAADIASPAYPSSYLNDLSDSQLRSLAEKQGYKLIFSGVIQSSDISKSMGGQGSQSLSFNCAHPYYVLRELMLKYAGVGVEAVSSGDEQNKANVAKSSWINQSVAVMNALQGISKEGSPVEDDPEGYIALSESMKDRFDRLKGCPGTMVVLWNMFKRDVYYRGLQSSNVQSFKEIYIPLIEEGIKFFSRMSGHPTLEEDLQSSKTNIPDKLKREKGTQEEIPYPSEVILPPRFRTFIADAAMIDLANSNMLNQVFGGDPDASSLYDIVTNWLNFLKYDLVVLNSPAILMGQGGDIVESLVKPNLPYYYAPICNVLLPSMYETFQVNHDHAQVPTRMSLRSTFIRNAGAIAGGMSDVNYVAPHSVRVGISDTEDLGGTLFTFNNKVGAYEWGSGIRPSNGMLSNWHNYLDKELTAKRDKDENRYDAGEGAGYDKAKDTWNAIHKGYEAFNPWDYEKSNVEPWASWNFMEADYEYMAAFAGTRRGSAHGVFNPFIVCGLPMDVVDPSPMRHSYHGFCTSVSHMIHAQGHAQTTIGMAACLTYDEIATNYIPMVNPWLSQALKLDVDHRLFNNTEAYKRACQHYHEVLGVGAADPTILERYDTGQATPIERQGGLWTHGPEVEDSEAMSARVDYFSTAGSLSLVARNIVSLLEVEADHADKENRPFIDIDMWNVGEVKSYQEFIKTVPPEETLTGKLEPGIEVERSPYLEYPDDADIELPNLLKGE